MSSCDHCYNPDKERACINCERNPIYPHLRDNYISYPIHCPFGFENCIYDPGYLWAYHRDWFIELYGDISPTLCACTCDCDEGDRYDDEDK